MIRGLEHWAICGLIILAATLGKFGGTLAAARLMGKGWRDATALGLLMNTRGLMELIVLNIGLDLGVITPTLFTMMVIMALVTTVATTPLVHLFVPRPTPQTVGAFASGPNGWGSEPRAHAGREELRSQIRDR
jgi:Kef-type K+ transport system membrane component KefB